MDGQQILNNHIFASLNANSLRLYQHTNCLVLGDLVYKSRNRLLLFKSNLFRWDIFLNNYSFDSLKILKTIRMLKGLFSKVEPATANQFNYLAKTKQKQVNSKLKSFSSNTMYGGISIYKYLVYLSYLLRTKIRAGYPARIFVRSFSVANTIKTNMQINIGDLYSAGLADLSLDYYEWPNQTLINLISTKTTTERIGILTAAGKGSPGTVCHNISLLLKIGCE